MWCRLLPTDVNDGRLVADTDRSAKSRQFGFGDYSATVSRFMGSLVKKRRKRMRKKKHKKMLRRTRFQRR